MASNQIITPHPDYTLTASEVQKVRDCISGAPAVKRKGQVYLKHYSQVDKTSIEAQEAYEEFLEGAEFDEIPGQTEKTLIGKIRADSAVIELPDTVSYLESDVDRDGLSMYGLINSIAREQLEVKFCVAVADYGGLFDLNSEQLSIEDLKAADPRATINLYTRENVIDWHHARVNGAMQLDYILLREITETFDPTSMTRDHIYSYIKLALDDDGYYYQQKYVCNNAGVISEIGEPDYQEVAGQRLGFIPAEIISDEESTGSKIPEQLGYLSSICDKTLQRYRKSALSSMAFAGLLPTKFVSGIGDDFVESFERVNERKYIAIGQFNALPTRPGQEAKVEVISADDHTQAFDRYKEQNEKEIRALGGVFPSDELRQRTLGEAELENSNWMARLNPMINALEQSLRQLVAYCAMFEGAVSPDAITDYADDLAIELNREFAKNKASKDELVTMLTALMQNAISKMEWLRFYAASGWTATEIEQIESELEAQGPSLTE